MHRVHAAESASRCLVLKFMSCALFLIESVFWRTAESFVFVSNLFAPGLASVSASAMIMTMIRILNLKSRFESRMVARQVRSG
jgi:hypothetical protein